MNMTLTKGLPIPPYAAGIDARMDKLWGIHERLMTIHGRMARIQSSHGVDAHPDEATFPPTYIVLQFSPDIHPVALRWLVDKITGKRRDGGAELLVRRQPRVTGEGVTLHVSASKIKFLEAAEEMELRKRDRDGLVREFSVSQLEDFLDDGAHVDDLLTTAERQLIVRAELLNVRALSEDECVPEHAGLRLYEGQSLLAAMLYWGLLRQMYALHDDETLHRLGPSWYSTLFGHQPFEEIRLYFGEAVALYFNFIGFYTSALVAPMLLGFLQIVLSADNIAFFCLFNVLWVTVFLELWKRKCNELAFTWGTIGMTSLDEPRPNFRGTMGRDAVTGRYQPQFPRWKTNMRMYCLSFPVVFLCMVGAFFVMLASFWAEDYLTATGNRQGLLVFAPSAVYAALVWIMNRYYRSLATALTEWENHRTQSQFDRHRVIKLVLFEFVNNFMSMFYIAFYIQDMDMLRTQLAIMLIILQAINNLQEAVLPLLVRYFGSRLLCWARSQLPGKKDTSDGAYQRRRGSCFHPRGGGDPLPDIPELEPDDPRIAQAVSEGEMEPYEGTYDDYLELYVQFGYVFLFSSVYPMAAFWAFVNNVLEIRSDAFKLCRLYQRPVAKRVKDTGAWQRSFEAVGAMSVMTNCGLLCMSAHMRSMAPDASQAQWVLMFVALEHAMLFVRYVLHKAIPDRPEWVRVALAKVAYQSRQALKHERMMKNRRAQLQRANTVHGSVNRSGD